MKLLIQPKQGTVLTVCLWRQSGSDLNLKHVHPLINSRHVGTEALPLSQYASYDTATFHLTSDDCICQPCYKDFQRKGNQENCIPRWAKIKQQYYSVRDNKHCMYCCENESECACASIRQWAPEEWYGEDTSIVTWKKFLSLTGKIDYVVGDHANHLCRTHYRRLFELKEL